MMAQLAVARLSPRNACVRHMVVLHGALLLSVPTDPLGLCAVIGLGGLCPVQGPGSARSGGMPTGSTWLAFCQTSCRASNRISATMHKPSFRLFANPGVRAVA